MRFVRRTFAAPPAVGARRSLAYVLRAYTAVRSSAPAQRFLGTRLAFSMAEPGRPDPTRHRGNMIIDDETFTQIALHIRRASDGLLGAARHMAVLCDSDEEGQLRDGGLSDAVESLVSMNEEFIVLERILRAIWEANRQEKGLNS